METLLYAHEILLKGAQTTATIFLVAAFGGMLGGTLLAAAKLSRSRFLSFPANCYINFFRSIPLVMVLLGFYLVMPNVLKPVTGHLDLRLACALVGFVLFESAYIAEIIASGLKAVPASQARAARALGFSKLQTFRLVTLPQALRNATPSLMTQAVVLFQDTALVYVIGLSDFFSSTVKVGERDGNIVQAILFASSVYFIVCVLGQRAINTINTKGARS